MKVTAFIVTIHMAVINISESLDGTEEALARSLLKSAVCTKFDKPTIGLSPARLIQAVALTKKLHKERSCKHIEGAKEFNINNPNTWSFCAVGECFDENCFCYSLITGSKCEKFSGNCWMVFCSPKDCESRYIRQLECQCEVQHSAIVVITGEYWYDEGLEHAYRRPTTENEFADFFEAQVTLNYTALYSVIHSSRSTNRPIYESLTALTKIGNAPVEVEPAITESDESLSAEVEETTQESRTEERNKNRRIAQDTDSDVGRSMLAEEEYDELDYSAKQTKMPNHILLGLSFASLVYNSVYGSL